jgi:hypothetical protein
MEPHHQSLDIMPNQYVEQVIKKIIRDVGGDRQRLKKRLLQKAKVDQKFLHRLTKPFLTGILSKTLRDMGQNMDQTARPDMTRPIKMEQDKRTLPNAKPQAPQSANQSEDESLDNHSLDRVLQAMAEKDKSTSRKRDKKKGVSKDHIDALTQIAKNQD